MPLLGKRKYINEKITELIKKLDDLGYDTRRIKSRFYETEYKEETGEDGEDVEQDEENSAGAILPYRKKINDVLNMIDNIINNNESNYNTNNNYELSNQFKNNLLREVNKQTLMNVNEDVPQNTFSLF